MSICERWEFEPSPASPLKGQTASLWQRLHCCVRRPCQPRTEATRRSADGILHSVSLVPMVLQVCFRRDCNCEPGHVLLVSLTPSQPHFPAACLHLHLCTYASTVCGDILENRSKHFEAFMPYKVCNCLCMAACMSRSFVNGKFPMFSPLCSLFFSIPLSSPRPSLQLFDTCLCVKQWRNWKYYMPQIVWRAFPRSLRQNVYNSFSLRLYLFLKPPLIQASFWCYVSAKVLVMLQMSGSDGWEPA